MRSSILAVLAVGFAGFGALEVAALNPDAAVESLSLTPARAVEPVIEEETPSASAAPTQTISTPAPEAEDNAVCMTAEMVAAFEPRHRELMDREARLDRRQAELADLEGQIQSRLDDMAETRTQLQAMTDRIDAAAGEDISHLVEMYSTMKPKKAAAIFDKMDPGFAAGFLREIDSARAGVIMAEMGEQQSYRVSLLIANRHAEWRNGQ